jgi:3-hydroxyacyl-CoA dehydrogenase
MQAEADQARARITYASTLEEACKDAYMVIENIPEILERKQEMFCALQRYAMMMCCSARTPRPCS